MEAGFCHLSLVTITLPSQTSRPPFGRLPLRTAFSCEFSSPSHVFLIRSTFWVVKVVLGVEELLGPVSVLQCHPERHILTVKSFRPANLGVGVAYAQISADVVAKNAAGYPPTLVDPYGRLLAYQLLKGPDGGVAIELSSITGFSNFTHHNVPFPIITSLNVETSTGVCTPPSNSVIYEFSPYEFGSFDSGVNAFTQTKYLGTFLSNGVPTKSTCETNYDNLGTFPVSHYGYAANTHRLHPRYLLRRLQRTVHDVPS